jgi:hypothetical protein
MLRFCLKAITLCAVTVSAAVANGDVMEFAVDPLQSQLTLTAETLLMGNPLPTSPQGAGSLTTVYTGTILTDVASTTIQFLAGSVLVAQNSGNWLPGDDYSAPDYLTQPDPANYGLVTDLSAMGLPSVVPSAVRDLEIALQHAAPVPLTAGVFDEGGIDTAYDNGTVFYSAGGNPPVTDLAGTVTPDPTQSLVDVASVTTLGDETTLVLPFKMTSSYWVNVLLLQQTYEGTIVATHVVPEPATLALLACGVGVALGRRRRGR